MKLQKTKVSLLSPLGESLTLKYYDNVNISESISSKVSSFSINAGVFDETEVKKYGVGSEVRIYSCEEDENINNHLIFKGIVSENPKKLNRIQKNYSISGYSKLYLSQLRIVNETYDNWIISDIVNDLIDKYALDIYSIGYIQPVDYKISIKFKDTHLYTCLERLAEALGFTFDLDLDDKFNFYDLSSKESNTILKMGDYDQGSSEFSYDSSQLVNSLTVYGGKSLTPDISQKKKGDGLNSTYLLNYKPRASTSGSIQVYLNGVSQSVGIEGLNEDGVDCIINYNEKNIKFQNSADNTEKILTTTDEFEAIYRAENPLITKISDEASIQKYGLKEDVKKFSDITDKVALNDRAKAHLRKYSSPIITGSLSTWKNIWNAGETVKVEIETEEGYFMNEWLQLTDKGTTLKPNELKVDLKFEQKKQLNHVIKSILERINEIEKSNENETVQQLDVLNDKVKITTLHKIHSGSSGNRLRIGVNRLGSSK